MTNKSGTNNFGQLKKFCSDNGYELGTDLVYGRYGTDDISVTELLSLIEDPSFSYIKRNHVDKIKEACDRGTEIHDHMEEDKNLHIDHNRYKNWRTFKQWKILYDIELIHKEKTFYRDGIRGTVDAITNLGIVDYKTSRRKNPKYMIQIAAYCWLSGIEEGYILYMDEKGFDFIEVEDLKYYTDLWLELLEYKETVLIFNKNT